MRAIQGNCRKVMFDWKDLMKKMKMRLQILIIYSVEKQKPSQIPSLEN
jgi:hypothetical protein